MVTIKIKHTGEVKQVTRNEAFDLIDRGIAEVYQHEEPKAFSYDNRQMRSSRVGKDFIKTK